MRHPCRGCAARECGRSGSSGVCARDSRGRKSESSHATLSVTPVRGFCAGVRQKGSLQLLRYRKEVDGLRAWAVLPVLAFHAGVPGFAGGFIGVDVFFVVSGYLITGILLRDIDKGGFSIVHFLERRARRIIPALYVVLLACLAAGWFLLLPDALENLGQSTFATVLSANNVLLLLTSGYWDISTELKPLLHTWSLGVEEQFYLIFPWVLLAVHKRGWTGWVLGAAAIASLALAEWTMSRSPQTAFFMLHTRAFELLAGAILAYAESRRGDLAAGLRPGTRGNLAILGLAMIAASVVLFDASTRLPGVLSLVPVVGTMLVIAFASETMPAARLLCHRAVVGVGLISYSLYLWHQPLLAFLRLTSAEHPTLAMSLGAVALAFPLAYLSWRFVERPFRQSGGWTRAQVFAFTILGGAGLAAAGLMVDREGGVPERVPEFSQAVNSDGRPMRRKEYGNRAYSYLDAPFTDASKPNVLILGNSYARDIINCAVENGHLTRHELSYHQVSWKDEISCKGSVEAIPEKTRRALAEADVAIFVLGAFETECWAEDVALYRKLGAKRIIVVGLKNFGWNPNALLAQRGEGRRNFRPKVVESIRVQNELDRARIVDAEFIDLEFIDLLGMLVDSDGRVPLLTPDGKLISEDGTHLTAPGARYIGGLLFEHPALRDLK
jgi:peptidoglycan/LPS O-acetylase OafA/YrhL